jgi:hypothetical protein
VRVVVDPLDDVVVDLERVRAGRVLAGTVAGDGGAGEMPL